ncbi:MAG: hydrolase [Proteobacteria bacterium SG_bin7]|nr:MAG: hydrolase [Proteobacteria bacterium SG_bin7]
MGYLANFNHVILGKGAKKLVFLHGLMGYGLNWRTLAKEFEADFEILLFDQRGHGKSFQPSSGYAPEDYADDLNKILNELQWQKIFLVGHSMGGRNALNFAYRFPACVDRLVIEDIGPESDPAGEKSIRELIEIVPVPFRKKEDARDFFQKDFSKLYKGPENARTIGLFLYSNLEGEPGNIRWRFSLPGILESVRLGRVSDRWHEVKALTMPTLVIRGEKSKDLSQKNYEQMIACNPNIQGVIISGAGHWAHADKPKEVAQALKDFLS